MTAGDAAAADAAVHHTDELDRLFSRLVYTVRDARPEYLGRAFEVGELLAFVPYRTVRTELGVDTNEDFEHLLTRLLAGERGYLFADELLQDDLRAELASPNPDLSAYRAYVTARVTLSQEHTRRTLDGAPMAVGRVDTEPAAPVAPAEPAAAAFSSPPAVASAPPLSPPRPAPRPVAPPARPLDATATAGTPRASRPGCRYCGQALPDGREIRFCPSCGQNLLVQRCAACSAELEAGWKFCVTCGRAAAP